MLQGLSQHLFTVFTIAQSMQDSPKREEIDRFLANVYRQYPALLQIYDSEGDLPLWKAYCFKLPVTLKTIMQINTSPRHHGRIICSYCLEGAVPIYFTNILNPLKAQFPLTSRMKDIMMKTAYLLLPFMEKNDLIEIAPAFFQEATLNSWEHEGLIQLIELGFDLSLKCINHQPFIEEYLRYMINNDVLFSIEDFLGIKKLHLTEGIIHSIKLYSHGFYNTKESDICSYFIGSMDMLIAPNNFNLDTFICNFNRLRIYGIDLRDFRYLDNRTLIELLSKTNKAKEAIDFILSRPTTAPITEKPWLLIYDKNTRSLQPEMQVGSFGRNTPARGPV